jgi:hypothetical protein
MGFKIKKGRMVVKLKCQGPAYPQFFSDFLGKTTTFKVKGLPNSAGGGSAPPPGPVLDLGAYPLKVIFLQNLKKICPIP